MADLPDQTDPQALRDLGECLGYKRIGWAADEIESLRARLAQAEERNLVLEALGASAEQVYDKWVAAEAALATARRDAALVAAQALMGIVAELDDIETAELVTRRAIQFEDEARAALVVADTRPERKCYPGCCDHDCPPCAHLGVADPQAKAHQEEKADS